MELFVHSESGKAPEIVLVEATEAVRTLLVDAEPDGKVWIEEVDEEVNLDLTFEEAGIRHRHHVHRGRCPRVKVVVQFNSRDFTHEYGPNTTIQTVYHWVSGERRQTFRLNRRRNTFSHSPALMNSLPTAFTSAPWSPPGPAR